jgi:hypothetical protein
MIMPNVKLRARSSFRARSSLTDQGFLIPRARASFSDERHDFSIDPPHADWQDAGYCYKEYIIQVMTNKQKSWRRLRTIIPIDRPARSLGALAHQPEPDRQRIAQRLKLLGRFELMVFANRLERIRVRTQLGQPVDDGLS